MTPEHYALEHGYRLHRMCKEDAQQLGESGRCPLCEFGRPIDLRMECGIGADYCDGCRTVLVPVAQEGMAGVLQNTVECAACANMGVEVVRLSHPKMVVSEFRVCDRHRVMAQRQPDRFASHVLSKAAYLKRTGGGR